MTTFVTYEGHIRHIHAPVIQDALFRQPRFNWLACGIWLMFLALLAGAAVACVWGASLIK